MNLIKVNCAFCGKKFLRPARRVNESKKFGWNQYCSLKCQILNRNKQKSFECGNPRCNKIFKRRPHEIPFSGICFCSTSCAAVVNNYPKRKVKLCPICGKKFYGQRKYCSNLCRSNSLKCKARVIKISKSQIINKIKKFYKDNGRIPLKRESHHYDAARLRYGTWNKAIKAAGFETNPVLFAKKHIANDGHKCDSFAEKIIDDWLYAQKIKHKRWISYPEYPRLTVDFVTKNNWIEFFGLAGDIKEYDRLIKKKQKLAKKYKLHLLEIYPKDLFPVNRLSEIIKN